MVRNGQLLNALSRVTQIDQDLVHRRILVVVSAVGQRRAKDDSAQRNHRLYILHPRTIGGLRLRQHLERQRSTARVADQSELLIRTGHFQVLLKALVEDGTVPIKTIDDAVRNILRLKFRLGLFEERTRAAAEVKVTPESREVAERLATETVVLLKNEGNLLPLRDSVRSVAVIGPRTTRRTMSRMS